MASTHYVNGRIYTGHDEQPWVSSFQVMDGRFFDVGADAASGVDSPVGAGAGRDAARRVDLAGATVIPAFIDVHCHPSIMAGWSRAVNCGAGAVGSIPELIAALKASPTVGAVDASGQPAWIEGAGFDETLLAEGRLPTVDDLDEVSATQPVYVARSDCHSGVANTVALERCGIRHDSVDPPGGQFGRFADGRLNGFLYEHGANDLALHAKAASDVDAVIAGVAGMGSHYARRGIVAVADMICAAQPMDALAVYRAAAHQGFALRAALFYVFNDETKAGLARHFAGLDAAALDPAQQVRVGGIKVFLDGSVSGRSAWMLTPYRALSVGDASPGLGMSTLSDAQLVEAAEFAREQGVQLAVHTMGDRSMQQIIDVLGHLEPWSIQGTAAPSIRIEHATMLSQKQIDALNAAPMRFAVASQSIFFFAEEETYAQQLSDEQYAGAYLTRSAFEQIPTFALSSDAPATTWPEPDNLFVSIQAAVTRRSAGGADLGQDQRLSVEQAVQALTTRSPRVTPFPELDGIRDEAEASFLVLDRDIFTCPPEQIGQTQIQGLYKAGDRLAPS